jgi:hypothetical protein
MAIMQAGRCVFLSLFLGSAACSAPASDGLQYDVLVDSSFTMDEQGAALSAIGDWSEAVPELKLTQSLGSCASPTPEQVCLLPEYAQPDPPVQIVGTTYRGAAESGTVYIYVNRIQAIASDAMGLTRQTVEHELGHAMGLQHAGVGTLMAANVSDQAPTITAADIAQFWAVRGR